MAPVAKPGVKPGTPEHMCGVCNTAWDIIMGRARPFDATHTAWHWLLKCRYGGCDPECWDFVSDDGKGTVIGRPPFSTRLYHRRDKSVPWNMETRRTVSRKELIDKDVEQAKKRKALEAAFDEPEQEEAEPAPKSDYSYDF